MALRTFKAVVMDIEGTTTPISFVSDVMFPYVARELEGYIRKTWNDANTKQDVKLLQDLSLEDKEKGVKDVVEVKGATDQELQDSVISNVRWQMSSDRKSTPLKSLQGHMWKFGFEQGELRGRLFDDIPNCLQRWKELQIPVYIYSSGSIEAQKLLFGYTEKNGDMLHFLKGHFDTTTGPKVESSSYTKIASAIETPEKDILFLTDLYQEAVAADQAGFGVVVSVREGNRPLPSDNKFPTATEFNSLFSLYKFEPKA